MGRRIKELGLMVLKKSVVRFELDWICVSGFVVVRPYPPSKILQVCVYLDTTTIFKLDGFEKGFYMLFMGFCGYSFRKVGGLGGGVHAD